MSTDSQIGSFKAGADWLRADFHLHTLSDPGQSRNFRKEFRDRESEFSKEWIAALVEQGVQIAVVTNHNAFDRDEYKNLRKLGKREGILVLPGVELNVKEGGGGIHTLIVFDPETWVSNKQGDDRIKRFLDSQFSGVPDEGSRTTSDLCATLEKLDGYEGDYFIVFAHVESDNGLLSELQGDNLKHVIENCGERWRNRVLGLQKVKSEERLKGRWHPDFAVPSFVEGSDPKGIDEVGIGKQCFLKVGELSFGAVKFALTDPQFRVLGEEPVPPSHSRIEAVSFTGKLLDGRTLSFSSGFTSLIGIRGSGKSTLIEAIRFALGYDAGEDSTYKNGLIPRLIGSGGQITLHAIDRHGNQYEIRRSSHEPPEVFDSDGERVGASIRESILSHPIYFGQKDLSKKDGGGEKDIVERLVGSQVVAKRKEIAEQKKIVIAAISGAQSLLEIDTQIDDEKELLSDAKHRRSVFEKHGVPEALAKETAFKSDEREITSTIESVEEFASAIDTLIEDYEDLKRYSEYESEENAEFFEKFHKSCSGIDSAFSHLKKATDSLEECREELGERKKDFSERHDAVKEEFSATRRALQDSLDAENVSSLDPDDFPAIEEEIEKHRGEIKELKKRRKKLAKAEEDLLAELAKLRQLWKEEFRIIEEGVERINQAQSALQIEVEFRGGKEEFFNEARAAFRGSGIQGTTLRKLVDAYADFTLIYENWDAAMEVANSSPEKIWEFFEKNLPEFLTYRVPDRYTISYKGKDLNSHSLGQRASALILFVLSKDDCDLIIIDQPEDDLDNQTIYEDVITLLQEAKKKTQFIFATHNANFPVLGDAELVHCFAGNDDAIELMSGSIDSSEIQTQIVNVMEGGKDAFARRKRIYDLWS
ncbi:MAG: histidinol-phosphatase [Verrucomicrobiales bacterium]|nr:histidinol-phosphatase [Verrucomicrobiales bacterium]